MTSEPSSDARGPLDGVRVIDLATERAALCGRILADLGAEVIVVEPPGGSPLRGRPPFDERAGHEEESLYWAAVALGKRSLVLDITSAEDQRDLRALIATADVLVESFDPGYLGALGLAYQDLRALNPALVYASVTPWGQDGPRAGQPATDLTIEAAGGLLGLQGDGDRPPVPVGYPQAGFHGGAQAAADIAIALVERQRSGLGQHLDVSMQACMVWTLMQATGYPPNEGRNIPGYSEERALPPRSTVPGLEPTGGPAPCADGAVYATIGPSPAGARALRVLLALAQSDGQPVPQALLDEAWETWSLVTMSDGTHDPAMWNRARRVALEVVRRRRKADLFELALAEDLLIAPIQQADDLVADPQLLARDYWRTIGGEFGGRVHPGPFARFSRTPLRLEAPAPALGTAEVTDRAPPAAPAPTTPVAPSHGRALEGLKVADFAWVGVGPLIAKALADHGAAVVHVESSRRPDVLRGGAPFKDGVRGIDRSQFFANFNSSKLGLALDLATPEGARAARALVGWADVVLESFTPGTMARFGLDWETLSVDRPDLLMISTCLRGQTGPQRAFGGFGFQGAALAGLTAITGWPDRVPAGPYAAYTDFINPRLGTAALVAAIYERNRSGLGQYIDLSQVEAALHFIEPLLLDYTVNGRVAEPAGHDSLTDCPHGVYPARGVERYVAISAQTTDQWRALVGLVAPSLEAFASREFDAFDARLAVRSAIDGALVGWTASQDPYVLEERLRRAGVPASVVQWPTDLYRDPQLAHRGFFHWLDHAVMGLTPYDGAATAFSRTPAVLRAAPALGADTHYVLTELLGMTDVEVAALAEAGALT